jgi:PAS domain S-box-containing protein
LLTKPLQQGDDLINVASPERREIVRNLLLEIQRDKLPLKSFAEYAHRNGTIVYLELSYVPVTNKAGDLTHIHLLVRDITQQKVFEKKLVTQSANASNLIEKANAIIIGVDTRGYVTDWNEHCLILTGFEKEEVFGQKFTDVLLADKERPAFDALMLRILNHELVRNYEIPVRTKSGRSLIFMLSSTPRTSAPGETIGIVFVGQDVTELTDYRRSLEIKVEERTRELQRALKKEKEVVEMKSRFVAIASHEFRTPLSSIQFSADFIKKNNQRISKDEVSKRLDNIEKQAQHMTYLLDDVLTYGKSEAGKIQLVISNITLLDFINKIIEEVGHSTKNTHSIKVDFIELPAELTTDEKLLRNVLINLLTNAIKFSPGREKVYLTVDGSQGQLLFSVRDDGIGIPDDEVDTIFEPFVRGKGVASIQGTGLGLSIVKRAVELLKGTIQAKSRMGTGTTFMVTLPR